MTITMIDTECLVDIFLEQVRDCSVAEQAIAVEEVIEHLTNHLIRLRQKPEIRRLSFSAIPVVAQREFA